MSDPQSFAAISSVVLGIGWDAARKKTTGW
jgi:hypothetical protein